MKTLIMLVIICLTASIMMVNLILIIPKFGSKHFGAPDDIKVMMSKVPDKPIWVNIIGGLIMILGLLAIIAVLVWAIVDTVKFSLTFQQAFVRFLILFEGYKLFDIIFFDYLMLTKLKLPTKVYPQTIGAKGYDNFGFNAKSQITKVIIFFFMSLILAYLLTILV